MVYFVLIVIHFLKTGSDGGHGEPVASGSGGGGGHGGAGAKDPKTG